MQFEEILNKLRILHTEKAADYSEPNNPFSNFEEAANFAGVQTFQTFEVLLGVKQARINQLLQPGRVAKNESLLDSYYDRAVYAILALNYLINTLEKVQSNELKSINKNSKDESSS